MKASERRLSMTRAKLIFLVNKVLSAGGCKESAAEGRYPGVEEYAEFRVEQLSTRL